MDRYGEGSVAHLKRLESDVTLTDAIDLFEVLQVTNRFFGAVFNDANDLRILAEKILISRFEEGQTIVEKGEEGSWFGILLTGDLAAHVPGGVVITVPPGSIIGEMAMWVEGSKRSAKMVAKEPGLLATMHVTELPRFMNEYPQVGAKLMTLMGRSAIYKQVNRHAAALARRPHRRARAPHARAAATAPLAQVDNMKRERSLRLKGRDGLGLEPAEAAAAMAQSFLRLLTKRANFTQAEAKRLSAAARYGSFKADDVILQAGQPWPWVGFVLSGSVVVDAWQVEVGAGGTLGALEFFHETLFADTSSVSARVEGSIACVDAVALQQLMGTSAAKGGTVGLDEAGVDGGFVHKLLHFIGGSAMQLCGNASSAADADGSRRDEGGKAGRIEAAGRIETFYHEKMRLQGQKLKESAKKAEAAMSSIEKAEHSVNHYKVLLTGATTKLGKAREEARETRTTLEAEIAALEKKRSRLEKQLGSSKETLEFAIGLIVKLTDYSRLQLDRMAEAGVELDDGEALGEMQRLVAALQTADERSARSCSRSTRGGRRRTRTTKTMGPTVRPSSRAVAR